MRCHAPATNVTCLVAVSSGDICALRDVMLQALSLGVFLLQAIALCKSGHTDQTHHI